MNNEGWNAIPRPIRRALVMMAEGLRWLMLAIGSGAKWAWRALPGEVQGLVLGLLGFLVAVLTFFLVLAVVFIPLVSMLVNG